MCRLPTEHIGPYAESSAMSNSKPAAANAFTTPTPARKMKHRDASGRARACTPSRYCESRHLAAYGLMGLLGLGRALGHVEDPVSLVDTLKTHRIALHNLLPRLTSIDRQLRLHLVLCPPWHEDVGPHTVAIQAGPRVLHGIVQHRTLASDRHRRAHAHDDALFRLYRRGSDVDQHALRTHRPAAEPAVHHYGAGVDGHRVRELIALPSSRGVLPRRTRRVQIHEGSEGVRAIAAIGEKDIIVVVQLQAAVVPPVGVLTHVHAAQHGASRRQKLFPERLHATPVCRSLVCAHRFLRHHCNIVCLLERERHP
mmetsp:Transcript_107953/g.305982  ORF Transcript_107953/g.305982 Transcript_107953/m.305982 type:complete len:311 (+) Transcript_107953:152-1084(+)